MFPRRHRLPRASFPAVLRKGRRLSSPNLTLLVLESAQGYAVVATKKEFRLAATRHNIKRRILAALRFLPGPLPRSIIVFPRASAASVSHQDIRKELLRLLSTNPHSS